MRISDWSSDVCSSDLLARRTVGADYGPDRMKRLVLALQLMTRLPLPAQHVDERDFAAAGRWLPATGIAVGLAVAGGAGAIGRAAGWERVGEYGEIPVVAESCKHKNQTNKPAYT